MSEWKPIETAPRNGTEIELTWMVDGKPQEIWPMAWNQFATNPLVQSHKGIWAMHDRRNGALLITWTESGDGGPTHWRSIAKATGAAKEGE